MRALLSLLMLISLMISSAIAEPRRVLLLHSFGPQFVPWVFFAERFREELFKRSADKIDLYEASLEGSRFQRPEDQGPFVNYLDSLFGSRKLDLIVTIGAPAAFFVQQYRSRFFPTVPLIIGAADQRTIDKAELTSNDTPVSVTLNFDKWIENILQVRPDTTHIAWAVGASPLERFWTEEFKGTSQRFADRITFEWFNDLRFEEMLKRVSELPPHSAVFYVDLRVDAAGVPLDRDRVLPRLRAATNAPIFSYIDSYLGSGIVGGPMLSSEEVGRRMAEAAVRILGGEAPSDLMISPIALGKPQYDWRELRHWNISENRLPAGSTIRFRQPTIWERYEWQLILASIMMLTLVAVIAWLLIERHMRRIAEQQSRNSLLQIMHLNRTAAAGALATSFAHEVSQPLGAIMNYAECSEILLKKDPPDIAQTIGMLGDIRRSDQRAADIIHHARLLLTPSDRSEVRDFDLNISTAEALDVIAAEAKKREVTLVSDRIPKPLPVRADPIHVQQVLLNLVINGMDAMAQIAPALRRMTIETRLEGDSKAVVSVSDSGTGIPADKVSKIFEPFYATKKSTGLGLAITRTIVESYGGNIRAENRSEGGAVFRITLPLVRF